MARRTFWATKIVRKPVRVRFTTWEGKRVSFQATKAVKKYEKVSFSTRRRR